MALLGNLARAVITTVSFSSSRVSPMIDSAGDKVRWLVPAVKMINSEIQVSCGERHVRNSVIIADPPVKNTTSKSPAGAGSLKVTVMGMLVRPKSPSVTIVLVVDRVMDLVGAGVLVGVLPWACRGGGDMAGGMVSKRTPTPASSRTAARANPGRAADSATRESRGFRLRPETRGGGGGGGYSFRKRGGNRLYQS